MGDCAGCENVNIYKSQTATAKAVLFDKEKYFVVRHAINGRKGMQKRQKFFPALEIPAGQFSDNHRMAGHLVL